MKREQFNQGYSAQGDVEVFGTCAGCKKAAPLKERYQGYFYCDSCATQLGID